jgi:hypothetical protein
MICRGNNARSPAQVTRLRRWIAPPPGSFKINIDAVKKAGNAEIVAAVCHASNGIFLGASAVVVLVFSDPVVLEALAS